METEDQQKDTNQGEANPSHQQAQGLVINQTAGERGQAHRNTKQNPPENGEVNKLSGVIFAEKYKLQEKLGSGAFGVIYRAQDLKNEGMYYGCKIEKADTKHPQIIFEARLYNYLHNNINRQAVGIPKCHYSGRQGEYNIMIMDLLGMSLESLFNVCKRKFTIKTTLMLADQLISRVEFLHSRNFLHRDIKPDNFLIGVGKREKKVYMIDFGLAKRFIKDSEHIPYKDGKNLTGTARYASINTHVGIEQSRRDDLESLAYMLIYFLQGSLPWQNIRAKDKKDKYDKIKHTKQNTSTQQLCVYIPEEFAQFLDYTKSLDFIEKPDYSKCKQIFRDLMKKHNYDYDQIWDWTPREQENPNKTSSQNNPRDSAQQQQRIFKDQNEIMIASDQKANPVPRTRNLHTDVNNNYDLIQGAGQRQPIDSRNIIGGWQPQSIVQINQHTEQSPRTGFRGLAGNSEAPGSYTYQQQQLAFKSGNSGSGQKNPQGIVDSQKQDIFSIMMNKESSNLMNSGGKQKDALQQQQIDQNMYQSSYIDGNFKAPVAQMNQTTSALAKQGNSIINNSAQLNYYQQQQQQQQFFQGQGGQINGPPARMNTSSGFVPSQNNYPHGIPVNPIKNQQNGYGIPINTHGYQQNMYNKNGGYPLTGQMNNSSNSNAGSRDISRENVNQLRGQTSNNGNPNANMRYE